MTLTTALIDYATDKLIDHTEKIVKVHVIERWSRHRARIFFDEFCKQLMDVSQSEEDIQQKLSKLMDDEVRSAIVFDAYRSVCLTRSKDIGPRIIALVTAEIITTSQVSSEEDDMILSASEEMNDAELENLESFVDSAMSDIEKKGKDSKNKLLNGALEVFVDDATFDSNGLPQQSVSIGPLDLAGYCGTWAPRAKRLGIISDSMEEERWFYREDSERHIDADGTVRRITWSIALNPTCLRLAKLIKLARKKAS